MTLLDPRAIAEILSDELTLTCDERGIVVAADERAEAVLEGCVGRPLRELALDGSREKVDAILAGATATPSPRHEIAVRTGGRARTLGLRTIRRGEHVHLLGTRLVEGYDDHLAELGRTMTEIGELQRRSDRQRRELEVTARELRESNQGLLSLHAQIDDQNSALRRAAEVKGRVVASVSHEFRTPLHSILGITRLLLDRTDGPLTSEQELQLKLVLGSAQSLHAMVDDLLDLSRLEAGKSRVRTRRFGLDELLDALRGTMRPLVAPGGAELVVEPAPEGAPELDTDDGKIAQVLRNLVSNALKFTERGEVRVQARVEVDDVVFRVSDTGIGIAEGDRERIFEEFEQIDGPRQRIVRGTGLGLALSRRLASLLQGSLGVESTVGRGSTFTLRVPRVHAEARAMSELKDRSAHADPSRAPVLVVEDNRQTMFLYERYLATSGFQVVPALTVADARHALERITPAAIVLDVMLEEESTWSFLSELKSDARLREIPVMVVTVVDHAKKARALGANEFWLKPVDPDRLRRKLEQFAQRGTVKVLVIDDDPAARYLIKKLLVGTPYDVLEAETGQEGVRIAREQRPQLILLDFVLGTETAFDVLDDLRIDPATRSIPVVLQTAKDLTEEERARLSKETASIVQKHNLSRELALSRIREALLHAGVGTIDKLE